MGLMLSLLDWVFYSFSPLLQNKADAQDGSGDEGAPQPTGERIRQENEQTQECPQNDSPPFFLSLAEIYV